MKNELLDYKNIILGFEIECYVVNNWDQFTYNIRKINSNIIIGNDGSIYPDKYDNYITLTCELRTPPLPFLESLQLLEKLFNVIRKYGKTNHTCGLHVNISYKNFEKFRKMDILRFLNNKIWNQILTFYKRKSNYFCYWDYTRKITPDLLRKMQVEKYRCCSIRNWIENDYNSRSTRRIEIRGFGNRNYHLKIKSITKYIYKIARLFQSCCDNSISS